MTARKSVFGAIEPLGRADRARTDAPERTSSIDEPTISDSAIGPIIFPIPPKPEAEPMPVERGFDGHTSAAYAPMIADPRSKKKSTATISS